MSKLDANSREAILSNKKSDILEPLELKRIHRAILKGVTGIPEVADPVFFCGEGGGL